MGGSMATGPDDTVKLAQGFTLQDRMDFVWRQVRFYIKNDAYLEGDFTLSSGKKSTYFLEMGNAINNCLCLPRMVELLHRDLVEIMRAYWRDESLVGIAGVALGGAQIVSAYTARHPYLNSLTIRIDREKNKGEIETSPHIKKGKVVLVDDILTTGKSLLFAKDLLEGDGFEVYKTFVFVDRQEGGLENCKEKGLEVKSFYTIKDILEA